MLYNKRWDSYSLESLIAWLQAMPPEQTYDARLPSECMLAQFARFNGSPEPSGKGCELSYRKEWADIAFGPRGDESEWTFGAALKRALD